MCSFPGPKQFQSVFFKSSSTKYSVQGLPLGKLYSCFPEAFLQEELFDCSFHKETYADLQIENQYLYIIVFSFKVLLT
jgi:hypothetical protein